MTDQQHHYFASCALGWQVAPTREEAVEKLIQGFSSDIKRAVDGAHKNGEPGCYLWSCKVHEPQSAHYKIRYYQPDDVEISEGRHHHCTYVTQRKVAFTTEKEMAELG